MLKVDNEDRKIWENLGKLSAIISRGFQVSAGHCHKVKQWFGIGNPSRLDLGRREKVNLNFYFHTSLWCLKRFYVGPKGLHKTF